VSEGVGKEEEKSFKVEDRRRFSESGEEREATTSADKEESPARDAGSQGEVRPPESRESGAVPEINFSTFAISLSTQVLVHLGEVPNPVSGKAERDLSVAKQMIDILGILREKTKGNLDQGEDKLLEDALYDLRIRYVEAVKKR
jgi:Domain of unknown function (DUF1844)